MPPSKEDIATFLTDQFPQCACTVESVGEGKATVRRAIGFDQLRPGGTVSGPVLMGVADVALYVAILGQIGIVPLAVTTQLSINFLRKPSADKAIVGKAELMKVGRTLITGDVHLYSQGLSQPVAHAVGTYALPPKTEHY